MTRAKEPDFSLSRLVFSWADKHPAYTCLIAVFVVVGSPLLSMRIHDKATGGDHVVVASDSTLRLVQQIHEELKPFEQSVSRHEVQLNDMTGRFSRAEEHMSRQDTAISKIRRRLKSSDLSSNSAQYYVPSM